MGMSMNVGNEKNQDDQSLKDVRIMNDEGLSWGLPSFLFFGGLGLTGAFTMMLPWVFGLLFGVVYFMAMYGIHSNDPKALQGWVEAMRRCSVWCGGSHKGRKIFYLSERQ